MPIQSLETLVKTMGDLGHRQYGSEAVSQLAHGLQCATLAEAAGSSQSLIAAALLHDIGHLIHDLGEDAAEQGIDDRHEYRAIPALKQLFGPAVAEPVRLHVNAKRYLCAVDRHYWTSLSPESQISLELQGGIYTPAEAEVFITQPFAAEAVKLRQWDDLAKNPDCETPGLAHFLPFLEACLMKD
jgi:phosphonate degradation associated HDIG domain protein